MANLTPVFRHDYRVGLPHPGRWVEIFNSDSAKFGGSNALVGAVTAEAPGWNDLDYSTTLTLPPLGVVWLAYQPETTPSAEPDTTPSAEPDTTPSAEPKTTPSAEPGPATSG